MVHLKKIDINADNQTVYPFSLPWLKSTPSIAFVAPVTIFVGENGAGKSTLMDLLATVLNVYRITSDDVFAPNPMAIPAKALKPTFTLTRPQGFFFEAEAFITYIHFLAKEKIPALKRRIFSLTLPAWLFLPQGQKGRNSSK